MKTLKPEPIAAVCTRLGVLAAVAAIAAAALVSTAWASSKTIHDRKGDATHGYADIKSVTATTTSTAVIWRIEAYEDFKNSKAPCVNVNPGAQKHPLGDEFNVCVGGVIHNFQHGGTAGRAKVTRPDGSTIVYRMHRSLFKGAKAISWIVNAGVGNRACGIGPCEQAPEGPGTHVVQKL